MESHVQFLTVDTLEFFRKSSLSNHQAQTCRQSDSILGSFRNIIQAAQENSAIWSTPVRGHPYERWSAKRRGVSIDEVFVISPTDLTSTACYYNSIINTNQEFFE